MNEQMNKQELLETQRRKGAGTKWLSSPNGRRTVKGEPLEGSTERYKRSRAMKQAGCRQLHVKSSVSISIHTRLPYYSQCLIPMEPLPSGEIMCIPVICAYQVILLLMLCRNPFRLV